MIRKRLTCPTCGDTWKKVIVENFVRLGPAMRECRACWTPFVTGEKEWRQLDGSARFGYFLQNLAVVVPLLGILLVALVASYFFNMVDQHDVKDYLIFGGQVLIGLFVLLTLRSLLMIVLSLRRSARGSSPGAGSAVEPPPEPSAQRVPHYPQGRPNPRPEDPSDHRGWPL